MMSSELERQLGDVDNTDNPKDLRAKLEAANKKLAEKDEVISGLQGKTSQYERDEQLREAGFGHLSKRQRRILLRELQEEAGDGELKITKEAVTEIVGELGFPTTGTTTTTTQQQNGNDGGQPDPNQPPPEVDQSLEGLDVMYEANQAAIHGRVDPNLETKIRETKNPEELRSLLQREGRKSGLMHSWDAQ